MLRYALFLALAVLLLAVPLQAETYTNEEHGFAIDFPVGWQVKGSSQKNTIIKAVYKDEQGRLAMVSVAAYPAEPGWDPWGVTGEQMYQRFKQTYPNADSALLDSGRTLVGGEHAIWTLIDLRSPAILSTLSRSYHFVRQPTLFRVSTSSDRDPAWFAQHESAFQESVKSFRFLNAQVQPCPNIVQPSLGLKTKPQDSLGSDFAKSVGEVAALLALTWMVWSPARLVWGRRLHSPAQYVATIVWLIVGSVCWFVLFGHFQTGRWLWN